MLSTYFLFFSIVDIIPNPESLFTKKETRKKFRPSRPTHGYCPQGLLRWSQHKPSGRRYVGFTGVTRLTPDKNAALCNPLILTSMFLCVWEIHLDIGQYTVYPLGSMYVIFTAPSFTYKHQAFIWVNIPFVPWILWVMEKLS